MPTPIQNATAWSRLQKQFGLLGRHKLLLDEVVVPVVILENITPVEVIEPVAASWSFQITAEAAKVSVAVLLNDSLSHRFLIDRLTMGSQSPTVFLVKLTQTAAVAALTGTFNKSWMNQNQTPVVQGLGFADSGAFVGNVIAAIDAATKAPVYWEGDPIVLDPGSSLAVINSFANLDTNVTMQGRVIPV